MSSRNKFDWISVPLSISIRGDISKVVKIGSRKLYIDYPNEIYISFIEEAINTVYNCLYKYYSKNKNVLPFLSTELKNRIYEILIRIRNKYNEYLKQNQIDWFKIMVIRAPAWSRSVFILGYRINRDKFRKFLNEISTSGIWKDDLSMIYDYINSSKHVILENVDHDNLKQLTNKIHINIIPDLGEAQKALLELENEISRTSMYIKYLLRRTSLFYPILKRSYFILKGIEIIVDNLKLHLGYPPRVYRELRKILEHLTHIYFKLNMFRLDLTYCSYVFGSIELTKCSPDVFGNLIGMVLVTNDLWDKRRYYFYAKNYDAYIKSFSSLVDKKIFEDLVQELRLIFPNVTKNKLKSTIRRNLSWSTLLTIGSFHAKEENSRNKELVYSIPLNSIDKIISISAYVLTMGLKVKLSNEMVPNNSVKEVERLLLKLMEKYNYVIPYPSLTFLVQYASYSLKIPYDKIYSNYSYFVHPYFSSIEYYPFLSIIEYKVLANELKKISVSIKQLLESIVYISEKFSVCCLNPGSS